MTLEDAITVARKVLTYEKVYPCPTSKERMCAYDVLADFHPSVRGDKLTTTFKEETGL